MAITNLTNTKWYLSDNLSGVSYNEESFNVNFISNGEAFTTLSKQSYRGYIPLYYGNIAVFNSNGWVNSNYRTIEITGGADVDSAALLTFLNSAGKQIKEISGFQETKTALKIYEDLTQAEYDSLEKEPNAFYLVNGVGMYKGEKLIASIADISNLESDVGQLQNYVGTLNANCSNLENNKQDKLTAGEGITIENNVISATGGSGGAPITIVDALPTANEENFKKGKIYTQGVLLQYIAKVTLTEPNLSQVASLVSKAYGIAAAAVGDNVYLFGGYVDSSMNNNICEFNTTTNTIIRLSTTLPNAMAGIAAAAVGTDIYLFGGYSSSGPKNTIYKFSTTTQQITTFSSAKLPTNSYDIAAAAVGTDIYLFGGYSNSNLTSINKFSTTTQQITTLSTTLPTPASSIAAAAVGTDIYLFGGYSNSALNTINKFSTTTQQITTLSAKLPTKAHSIAAAAVGTDIYLFGGNDGGSNLNRINKFSTTTNQITTLSTTLNAKTKDIAAAAVGDNVYLFGGYGGSALNTINKAEFGFAYQYKTITAE